MQSKFHRQKRLAFESFSDFAAGKQTPEWPLEIFLEVSNVCDLKCAMCPTFSGLNPRRFTNLQEMDRGLMQLGEHTLPLESVLEYAPVVHAHGYGEPTIHPEFTKFISYLAGFEVLLDFFTNGMHLTDALCEVMRCEGGQSNLQLGQFELFNLPTEADGTITLQAFIQGHVSYVGHVDPDSFDGPDVPPLAMMCPLMRAPNRAK